MITTLTDPEWELLLQSIKGGKCTPFIGAGACVGTLPLGFEIAREWADRFEYPFDDNQNLAKVSEYLAIKGGPLCPKEEIQFNFSKIAPPNFSSSDEPHALLADLPLPIYITTNYDSFMFEALKSRGRDPRRELCRWNKYDDGLESSVFGNGEERKNNIPTPGNPLVYHLHGHYDELHSMVLTETDYWSFMAKLRDRSLLPQVVRTALTSTTLLFIGYSLADVNFRMLIRSLDASSGYSSVAVLLPYFEPNDDALQDDYALRAQNYLEKYFDRYDNAKSVQPDTPKYLGVLHEILFKRKFSYFYGDVKDFTVEFRKRWDEFSNGD